MLKALDVLKISTTMALQYQYHTILVLLIFVGNAFPQSPCDSWEPYKDESCINIFNNPGVLGYSDAATFCSAQSANLMIIDTQEKQDFIENFLRSSNVADNVWLGLKYTESIGYEWIDGTPFRYSNWAAGNPKNDSSYCVQIHTEDEEYGKWSEVVCSRKNLVLCEKLQLWSYAKLQKTVMNGVKNPVPMGFIYVQLPKEKLPSEIWPQLGWAEITTEYAGVFFRAEGGNSSSFGEIQEENAPRLVHATYHYADLYTLELSLDLLADNQESKTIRTAVYGPGYTMETGLSFKTSSGEVRPRNMAIRIWKRIE